MPEIINPFDQDNMFDMASLGAAIEILPNMYGRVNQLGLFVDEGLTTRTVIVEEDNGVLNLLPFLPTGAPGTQNKTGKRASRSFTIPHIPAEDVIKPEEFQGVREFGQPNTMRTLATVMNKHLQSIKNKFLITEEYLKMGAIKGIIYDAYGNVYYNLYTEFGISPKTVDFALSTTSPYTDIGAKCREILRHMEDNLKGEVMNKAHVLVDSTFFDAFISHPNVEKFYLNWQAAAQIAGVDPRKGFTIHGVTFEEYRGTATDPNGVARPFIAAGEGHAFPMGTMNTFKKYNAPGNFIETANTIGQPYYIKQALEKMGRWVDIHAEANPLPMCCRPAVLVKVTKD